MSFICFQTVKYIITIVWDLNLKMSNPKVNTVDNLIILISNCNIYKIWNYRDFSTSLTFKKIGYFETFVSQESSPLENLQKSLFSQQK